MEKPKVLFIVGPTASGKTAWALQCARIFDGEIISADSRQVYKGMDIGTGKEVPEDVPHHLIDVVEPDEDYTLAHFLEDAKKTISQVLAKGKLPIVVGGTGLYSQALIENWLVPDVEPNAAYRRTLESKSLDELKTMLEAVDPEHVQTLGDGKRYLIRALEMHQATGKKPSELKRKQESLYDCLVLGVQIEREDLYARIDARVDDMFLRGLEDEVSSLLERYPSDLKALKTIGYQQFIDGSDDPKKRIKYASHAYARRQLTWLKRMKYVVWFKDVTEAKKHVASWLDE